MNAVVSGQRFFNVVVRANIVLVNSHKIAVLVGELFGDQADLVGRADDNDFSL